MTKLDQEFIKTQKTKLLQEKARLQEEIKKLEKFPQLGDSEEFNSEEVADFSVSQGQEEKLVQMYEDVKKALKKINEGTYGICENCKEKTIIRRERLEAFPAATTCIKCDDKK